MMLAVVAVLSPAVGQGFLNLNFESAQNLPANPPFPDGTDLPATNALPGWTAYNNNVVLSEINYVSNEFSGSSTVVELQGGSLALSGDFSVALFSDGSISQTGLVPSNAGSLEFEAAHDLEVILGGQSLSYSALSEGPGYTIYEAGIPSDMDGQTEELTFKINGPGQTLLDNIEFLPTSVPEPAEGALIGVGAVLFGGFRWRRRGKWI